MPKGTQEKLSSSSAKGPVTPIFPSITTVGPYGPTNMPDSAIQPDNLIRGSVARGYEGEPPYDPNRPSMRVTDLKGYHDDKEDYQNRKKKVADGRLDMLLHYNKVTGGYLHPRQPTQESGPNLERNKGWGDLMSPLTKHGLKDSVVGMVPTAGSSPEHQQMLSVRNAGRTGIDGVQVARKDQAHLSVRTNWADIEDILSQSQFLRTEVMEMAMRPDTRHPVSTFYSNGRANYAAVYIAQLMQVAVQEKKEQLAALMTDMDDCLLNMLAKLFLGPGKTMTDLEAHLRASTDWHMPAVPSPYDVSACMDICRSRSLRLPHRSLNGAPMNMTEEVVSRTFHPGLPPQLYLRTSPQGGRLEPEEVAEWSAKYKSMVDHMPLFDETIRAFKLAYFNIVVDPATAAADVQKASILASVGLVAPYGYLNWMFPYHLENGYLPQIPVSIVHPTRSSKITIVYSPHQVNRLTVSHLKGEALRYSGDTIVGMTTFCLFALPSLRYGSEATWRHMPRYARLVVYTDVLDLSDVRCGPYSDPRLPRDNVTWDADRATGTARASEQPVTRL